MTRPQDRNALDRLKGKIDAYVAIRHGKMIFSKEGFAPCEIWADITQHAEDLPDHWRIERVYLCSDFAPDVTAETLKKGDDAFMTAVEFLESEEEWTSWAENWLAERRVA